MRRIISKMDIWLLIATIFLVVLGLIMIYSASNVTAVVRYGLEPSHFFVRQAVFVVAALLFGIFIISFPTRNYSFFAWVLIFLIIFALGFLFVYGRITNSAISWYDFKFFKIQPSEFAKSILIVFSAVYYHNLNKHKVLNIYAYFIPLAFSAIIIGLVLMQPDLGSAAITTGITFMMFISMPVVRKNSGKVTKIIVGAIIVVLLGLLFLGKSLINDMQLSRFNFRNPCSRYTEKTGYQVCNGFIAINNGGLFGVGLGKSTQKYLYLPESHTDFIFPIIVEELGLVTGIVVVLLYLFILYRIFKIAKTSETLRCSVLAYGTFWYLTFHILINLMGVLALIPLTGVPLPFLSYGGSFTINAIIMIMVVERVAIENNINKVNRQIKGL